MNNTLPDDEVKLVTDVLAKLEPGFLPLSIFHEIARLTATPVIEIVPLRRVAGRVQILLTERDANDLFWPGQPHVPGTVIRATDTLESAFARVFNQELGGVAASRPTFVENILNHSNRGAECSQIYWIDVTGETTVGQFYDVEKLPETVVASQMNFIPAAIESYKRQL